MFRLKRLLLVASAFLWVGNVLAEDSALVRLGFLLNFARYVEWPEAALKPGAPLRFCLAPGDADMAAQFGGLAKQSIQGRSIQVKQIARPADIGGCHLLYLPAEIPGALSVWLGAAQQTGALTVGDLPDLVEAGGIIGLVSVGGRYRFDVNLGVARQADLRLSSQLLKLARAVK
jgi:hypothetical protein